MTADSIKNILQKRLVIDVVDHYINQYNSFPDQEWFEPNNKENAAFTVASDMHDFGLLVKKRIPTWKNDSFTGYKILFKKL